MSDKTVKVMKQRTAIFLCVGVFIFGFVTPFGLSKLIPDEEKEPIDDSTNQVVGTDYDLPNPNNEVYNDMKLDIDGEDPVHKLGLFHDPSKNTADGLLKAMYYLTFTSKENRADITMKIFQISGSNGLAITKGQQLVLDMIMIKDNPEFVCEKQGEVKCNYLKGLLDSMYDPDMKEYLWDLFNHKSDSDLQSTDNVKDLSK